MIETLMNRARLATKSDNSGSLPNFQTQTLTDGVVASGPLVALAYSYASMYFSGDSTHAGGKITVECNGNAIALTLGNDGSAQLSLLPFIRERVIGSGALANPLYCTEGAETQQNKMRGYIDVSITEEGQQPVSMRVYYIFGNYAPLSTPITDLYFDFDAEGETWVNVDDASNYASDGTPTNFANNWCNINEIVDGTPSGDFVLPLNVAWYYNDVISMLGLGTINYHFRYDCRTTNVLKVRWLDTNGNINTRKFTIASRAHGSSTGVTWQLPHAFKSVVDGYDRGKDQWGDMVASETITIGDECIPITHFDWVKTIASSPCIEVRKNGVWTRVNLGDANIECDPRKAHFSVTLSLVMPTDDVQQF